MEMRVCVCVCSWGRAKEGERTPEKCPWAGRGPDSQGQVGGGASVASLCAWGQSWERREAGGPTWGGRGCDGLPEAVIWLLDVCMKPEARPSLRVRRCRCEEGPGGAIQRRRLTVLPAVVSCTHVDVECRVGPREPAGLPRPHLTSASKSRVCVFVT